MGNMKKGTRKKKNVKASEVEYVCTIEPEQNLEDTEHQSGEQHEQPPVENDEEHELPAAENDEEPELPAAENSEEPELPAAEHELPANETESELPAPQPKHKIKRGPTRLKHIAKDPSTREKVDYNEKGQPIGPGSKLLSSYAGCLVREHVPVTIADWRLVSQELKTVLWKSIQARFEVDEEYQKIQVLGQMGCDWRSYKSRLATAVRKAPTNKDRMDLKPKNMLVNDWRRFIKDKTSKSFKVVSDKFKKIRKIQIPHTVSRKGMARLEEEMKMEAPEPSEISRTDVWVRSRTKKDGTPVNTVAAEKIRKAAELKNDAPSSSTNPKSDVLSQVLGADNPGRLRAMGRGMSMTKLAFFQVNSKCMAEMKKEQVTLKRKVDDLEAVIDHFKRGEAEVGENSAPRSVTNRAHHPKCLLLDYNGTGDLVAEARVMSSDPEDFVNGIPLGPDAYKVLVESAIKEDACIWRPATNILNMEQAVGEMIAWPDDCIILEDNEPESPKITSNKCTMKNWRGKEEVIVAEGRWESKEPDALVNGLPIGPNAVKVFVDVVIEPKTFLWRPTTEISRMEHCLKKFVAWPASRVVYETTTDKSPLSESQIPTPNMQTGSSHTQISEITPSAPMKKAKSVVVSPLRRSPRKQNKTVNKENQKCILLDINGTKRVVAEGRWSSNSPDQVVHCTPLGPKAVRVWVDVVKVDDAAVWRRTSGIQFMEDAHGLPIAWPEDKVVMV